MGSSVGWASDFGSGHDLTVCEPAPHADSAEPAWDSLSPSLCPSLPSKINIKKIQPIRRTKISNRKPQCISLKPKLSIFNLLN